MNFSPHSLVICFASPSDTVGRSKGPKFLILWPPVWKMLSFYGTTFNYTNTNTYIQKHRGLIRWPVNIVKCSMYFIIVLTVLNIKNNWRLVQKLKNNNPQPNGLVTIKRVYYTTCKLYLKSARSFKINSLPEIALSCWWR